MSKELFKKGDLVKAFGVNGEVIDVDYSYTNHPVIFAFGKEQTRNFTSDGKYDVWHKEPSLFLVERPEQFEEVTMYQSVYKDNILSSVLSKTKEDALECDSRVIGFIIVKVMKRINQ